MLIPVMIMSALSFLFTLFLGTIPYLFKSERDVLLAFIQKPIIRKMLFAVYFLLVFLGLMFFVVFTWNNIRNSPNAVDFLTFDSTPRNIQEGYYSMTVDIRTLPGLRWGRYEIVLSIVPVPQDDNTEVHPHTVSRFFAHGLPFYRQRSVSLPEFYFSRTGAYMLFISTGGRQGRQIYEPISIMGTRSP